MAKEYAINKPRYPQSFHLDEEGNELVEENMRLGGYGIPGTKKTKSDMFRDAVKELNTKLKQEAIA
jgi:hypothetical protein